MTSNPRTRTETKSKTARAADIRTNRWESELPILDRVLPVDNPTVEGSVGLPPDDGLPPDNGLGDESAHTVTINDKPLSYEATSGHRQWRRRLMTVLLPVAAVGVTAASLLIPAAASAQADPDLDVKSVRFDLSTEGAGADYRSVVVVNPVGEERLAPLTGAVRVTMDEDDANAMSSVVDGYVSGVETDGFANSVAAAATSPDVNEFVRLGRDSSGKPASFNLFFSRALTSGDHVLVQEGNGDGIVEIAAIDATGVQTGDAVVVSSPYEFNTGHGIGGSTAWASVVAVDRFGFGEAGIAGIRVSAADSEVKAMALVSMPAAASEDGPGVLQAGDQDDEPTPPGLASVGLAATVHPTIAVDGTGCISSGSAPVSVGQAVTFCFVATNLGSTNLSGFRFTDPQLGLTDATLPLASGGQTLTPGQQAVFYHHAVAGSRSGQVSSVVTAQPVDGAGAPLPDFISTNSASASTPIAAETAPEPQGQANAEAAAEIVEAPAVMAIDVTPTAANAGAATNEAAAAPPTQLAMTGMPTEPWILVILAMGLIFIGYTAVAAFSAVPTRGGSSGHQQLDALGFD